MNLQTHVSLSDNQAITTTSLKVAEAFGKNHRDILRKIDSISCSKEFRSAHFCAHPYKHPQNGETYTYYEMTKDGFIFLVMGFTGKQAAAIKEAYINAFNQMAEELQRQKEERYGNPIYYNENTLPDASTVDYTLENGRQITAIIIDGKPWVPAWSLRIFLQYCQRPAISRIYHTNRIDFDRECVRVYQETGSEQYSLLFSPKGCLLISGKSTKYDAKYLQAWALEMMTKVPEGKVIVDKENLETLIHYAQLGRDRYGQLLEAKDGMDKAFSRSRDVILDLPFAINAVKGSMKH
ncbi:Rha family transcriptional regulator [Vibrio parahaemolyticus]|nr:Rha family transcriptional regulator [Vibrio parahaemolyticus]